MKRFKKYLLDVEVSEIARFEKELFEFIDTKYSEVVSAIKKEKEITEKTEEKLVEAITKFKEEFK